MTLKIPTSIEDFRHLREQGFEYVDKTKLITEFIDRNNYKVILLPRPRRFGKSVNLSTLKWFFEKREENVWHLFDGLHVSRAGEKYRAHFQKYPVVHISFKGAKADVFAGCLEKFKRAVQEMMRPHVPTLHGKLSPAERSRFQAFLDAEANEYQCELALSYLTEWLHRATSVRPIVLIDEYDAPIHAGYAAGYYDKVINFFRSFYEAGLKDNQHLERGVMTGILRVSRESIFSELNSVGVYSLIDSEFNTCFGFTDAEVRTLLEKSGMADLHEAIRSYYNGYEFGGVDIYNPWSILSFLARNDRNVVPYWVSTSSNALIKELLQHHAFSVQNDVQRLLEGGVIDKHIDENVVFPELKENENALWNLLVFSGYLKASRPGPIIPGTDRPPFRLSIPNREVAEVYRTTFHLWMKKGLRGQGGDLGELLDALLGGHVSRFEGQLQKFAGYLPSYHDVSGVEPERFYQGLMIGLLASLEPDYEVRSNRESGEGRPDVLIKPRHASKPGVVLELKSARKGEKTLEQAMAEGLRQLEAHDYAADLRAAGVETIQQMVVGFDGKRVMVLPKGAPAPKKKRTAMKTVRESIGRAAKKVVAKARSKVTKTKR
ncbi:MAG: AAA family ATPase [Polyangiaceae bacterium]|nr:AAA family ATPase [Polyangiaceae bacterium]